MRRLASGCVTLAVLSLLAVGGSEPGPLDGDARCVGFAEVTYRAHNELNQNAATGESLGEGDLLDCDGSVVGKTALFAVEGVNTSLAIAYEQSGRMTVYIAEGLAESEWPEALHRHSR